MLTQIENVNMYDPSVFQQVCKEYHDYYNNSYFDGLLEPVKFNITDADVFGYTVCYGNHVASINLSPQIFHSTSCFDTTIAHEICHQADFQFIKSSENVVEKAWTLDGHGSSWCAYMMRCGKQPKQYASLLDSLNPQYLEFVYLYQKTRNTYLRRSFDGSPIKCKLAYSIYGQNLPVTSKMTIYQLTRALDDRNVDSVMVENKLWRLYWQSMRVAHGLLYTCSAGQFFIWLGRTFYVKKIDEFSDFILRDDLLNVSNLTDAMMKYKHQLDSAVSAFTLGRVWFEKTSNVMHWKLNANSVSTAN